MNNHAALILAAGKGTRMHSHKPKVLQNILGEPLLWYVVDALRPLFTTKIWAVIGHQAQMVRDAFVQEDIHFVFQEQQLGTGHALMQAMPALEASGCTHLLVINGDAPLVPTATLQSFIQKAAHAHVAFATIALPDPGAYGRVVRCHERVTAIVEAKDYDVSLYAPEPHEVNAGVYYLHMATLRELLPRITNINKSGEYYITDIIQLAVAERLQVLGVQCGDDANLLGINSPLELVLAEERLRQSIVQEKLQAGVILRTPDLVRISPRAAIAPGAEINGPCEIYGKSVIAQGARIESHCVLCDAIVETGARIRSFTHIDKAHVGVDAIVGPFARLRPEALLQEAAHVGNFVEIKKAILGKGAKANHLSYIGDADVGAGTNIGAGTITCNYDGKNKYRTVIGERAFIGSNTALVAPVTVGDEALIGAGSVITKDVPQGTMAIARAKQSILPKRRSW